MRFICLCPTYKRPWSLVGQAVDCFLKQIHKDAFLLVYDDLGSLPEQSHENWRVVSTSSREPDMISKYERMMEISEVHGKFAAIALWDDDDIYLPSHLEFHNHILAEKEFSYPSKVWTTHNAQEEKNGMKLEDSGGRFWASSAMRMDAFRKCGFSKSLRANFDLVNLHGWLAVLSCGDPCSLGDPTYVYRWGDTGCWHLSTFGRHDDWYERIGRH